MRHDRFTTTPEAAARFEADRTPAYDEAADRYDVEGYVRASWPIEELRAVFGPMTRQLRCAHPHCRTSLDEDTAIWCDHSLPFCEGCTWEEACSECGAEAGAA